MNAFTYFAPSMANTCKPVILTLMDKPKPSPETLQPCDKLGVRQSRTWPDGSALIVTSDAIMLVEAPAPYSVSPCSTVSSPVNPTS